MTNERDHDAERGQTIPFWVFALGMSLSLIFFVYNYSNTLRYQIRAQNAADSAATAALAGDAAKLNSVQTLLLALNVQELKTRTIISAVPALLTGGDSNCSGPSAVLAQSCLSDLSGAVNGAQAELTNLTNVENALNTFSGQLTGNNISNLSGTVTSFFANNCVALSTDCAFKYTTVVGLGSSGLPYVDEYACEPVPTFQYGYFLPKAPKLYYAVGHTSYTLAPVGTDNNPLTALPSSTLNQSMSLFPNVTASTLTGSLAGLNVGTGYYETVPVKSTQAPRSAKSLC